MEEKIKYAPYTQEDATVDGIGWSVSRFSIKAMKNSKIIGKIIFEDKPLRISKNYINDKDENAKNWYNSLNRANSIYLRKIYFNEQERLSGELENMFDYVTLKVLRPDHLIWTIPAICGKDNIKQIGGFLEPMYSLPNKNIRLFALNL